MATNLQRFVGGMVTPQQWLDLLRPKLPNMPPDMIKHEVLSVLSDFCRVGGAWRDWLRPVEIDGKAWEYGLPTGNPHSAVVAVLRALRSGDQQPLDPVPPELAPPPGRAKIGGLPLRYWQTQPDRLFVEPIPAVNEPASFLDIYVTLTPVDLCGIPEWFLADNQLAVVDGVLGKLCRVAGPNYRPLDAARHWQDYTIARNRSRARAMSGYNRATTAFRPPFMARGSQR
jgi:hypothetical protein